MWQFLLSRFRVAGAQIRAVESTLDAARDCAPVLLRLAFGFHLVQYTWQEILLLQAHIGFAAYLAGLGVPAPAVAAYAAMGTEFFGGLCWIAGLWVRRVSVLLTLNFSVALVLVHHHHLYAQRFEAVQMLAVSLYFVFAGAGGFSLDAWRSKRRARGPEQPTAGGTEADGFARS